MILTSPLLVWLATLDAGLAQPWHAWTSLLSWLASAGYSAASTASTPHTSDTDTTTDLAHTTQIMILGKFQQ